MGTSLTGTKPKDTYDSLIKVGDNGPISGTAKTLSDGLGNDLPISVSTSNVGIGTSAPARLLSVAGIGKFSRTLTLGANDGTTSFGVYMANEAFASNLDTTQFTIGTASGSNIPIIFATNAAERVRVTDNGLTFNGDTAAANALDDYEEGTFTPTMAGATFAYSIQSGFYTKIGRQVTIFIDLEATYSSPTGVFSVNLPFTVLSTSRGEGVVRPITGVTFTNYVTCEAVATSLYFENCFTSTGSASSDMNSTNFNSAGFRFFAAVTFFV